MAAYSTAEMGSLLAWASVVLLVSINDRLLMLLDLVWQSYGNSISSLI